MIYSRPLQSTDAKIISELHRDMIENTFTTFPDPAKKDYIEDCASEKINRQILEKKCVMLGAFNAQGEAVGYMFGSPPIGGVGTIIWLAINSDYRNNKIGSKIVGSACAEYKSRKCHKLRVHTHIEEAKQFYLHIGWVEEGFHPKQWYGVDYWSLGKLL